MSRQLPTTADMRCRAVVDQAVRDVVSMLDAFEYAKASELAKKAGVTPRQADMVIYCLRNRADVDVCEINGRFFVRRRA